MSNHGVAKAALTKSSTTITPLYLSELILRQTKDYTNEQLIYTSLIKSKFIEVLSEGNITSVEKLALTTWTSYVFGGEESIPLSLAVVRSNSFKHLSH